MHWSIKVNSISREFPPRQRGQKAMSEVIQSSLALCVCKRRLALLHMQRVLAESQAGAQAEQLACKYRSGVAQAQKTVGANPQAPGARRALLK